MFFVTCSPNTKPYISWLELQRYFSRGFFFFNFQKILTDALLESRPVVPETEGGTGRDVMGKRGDIDGGKRSPSCLLSSVYLMLNPTLPVYASVCQFHHIDLVIKSKWSEVC